MKHVGVGIGDSMEPTIHSGAVFIWHRIKEKETLSIYDIVLFKSKGYHKDGSLSGRQGSVMHRIVAILPKNRFVIKGDNRDYEEIVQRQNIFGKCDRVWQIGNNWKVGGAKAL